MRKWVFVLSLILLFLFLCLLHIGCQKATKSRKKVSKSVPLGETKKRKKEIWKDYYIYFAHKDTRTVSPAQQYPLFKMKANGSELVGTNFGGVQIFSEWGCSFSRDGRRVAWTEISGKRQVVTMNTDGTNKVVIKQATEAYDPVISHDGNTIAFVLIQASGTELMKENIALANIENPQNVLVVQNPYSSSSANCPTYDAFGKRIYFDAQIYESRDIFSVDALSGKEIIRHTADNYINIQPQVTPDGKKIVFVSNRSGKNDIYISTNRGITVSAELDDIEEQEAKDRERDIFKNQQILRLTYEGENKNPAISPDGKMVAFSSNRDGDWEIYIMAIDGSKQTRLTFIEGDDLSPIWSLF